MNEDFMNKVYDSNLYKDFHLCSVPVWIIIVFMVTGNEKSDAKLLIRVV